MATGNQLVESFAEGIWEKVRDFHSVRPESMTDDRLREIFGPEMGEQIITDLTVGELLPAWQELTGSERFAFQWIVTTRVLPASIQAALTIMQERLAAGAKQN
jgi:hypothetical protein